LDCGTQIQLWHPLPFEVEHVQRPELELLDLFSHPMDGDFFILDDTDDLQLTVAQWICNHLGCLNNAITDGEIVKIIWYQTNTPEKPVALDGADLLFHCCYVRFIIPMRDSQNK